MHVLDADDLRSRIGTQETSYFPFQRPAFLRWWRWWWNEPRYFDTPTAVRDQLRIQRYYQAHGFHRVEVSRYHLLDRDGPARVQWTINEGPPTRLVDIRLHGCESGDTRSVPAALCETMRERLGETPGARFDEAALDADRSLLREAIQDSGFPMPAVRARASVDPTQSRAWVEFTLHPGPEGRFGVVDLELLPSTTPYTADRLPNGLPISVIYDAVRINRGQRYSRRVLAEARRALDELRVFGVVRLEEDPHPDGTVDLHLRVSPARLWRLNIGGGAQIDPIRPNIHATVRFDHRNAFGDFRRLRIEARPLLYFNNASLSPFTFGEAVPGASVLMEVARPEFFSRTELSILGNFDLVPDPYVPLDAYRRQIRARVQAERRFSLSLTGTASVHFTDLDVYASPLQGGAQRDASNALISNDPIYRQLLAGQRYIHLEQHLTWDRRNEAIHPTRGTLVTVNLAESLRGAGSDYSFVRMHVDARGFIPISTRLTLGLRGQLGLIVGDSSDDPSRGGWPVPPDLRFYLGGTLSNRGYPFNRVGPLAAIAQGAPNSGDDPNRTIPLGGTAMWDASVELRWHRNPWSLVTFFDVSQIVGIDTRPFTDPQGVSASCTVQGGQRVLDRAACQAARTQPTLPPPMPFGAELLGQLFTNAQPAVGVGVRYDTPVGPIRLDLALRLADLGCTRTDRDVAAQQRATASRAAPYYVLSTPRCSLLGFDLPVTLNISFGEVW